MQNTYRYLSEYTTQKYLEHTNEELVNIYKGATTEYEKSQAYGALFVKNFWLLLRISNKYNYLDSAEKAGMITEELLNSIFNYDGTTKFITYLTARVDHSFLWKSDRGKRRAYIERGIISLGYDEEYDNELEIEDRHYTDSIDAVEFLITVNNVFDIEIENCETNSRKGRNYRERLIVAKRVIQIILEDDNLAASQIARKLGWYKKDRNGNINTVYKPRNPDYVRVVEDGKVRVYEQPYVKEASWGKVNRITKIIKDVFIKYGLNNQK